jgi:PIN domain nuclease of toxin-antitoxin system
MKLLLDTNVVLWAANGDLRPETVEILDDEKNQIFYSTASIWEIVIKHGLNKPEFKVNVLKLLNELKDTGYKRLDIKEEHILVVGGLEKVHTDPFDRLLIAQAEYEGITIMTADKAFLQYKTATQIISKKAGEEIDI